jgi:hypothetical protein
MGNAVRFILFVLSVILFGCSCSNNQHSCEVGQQIDCDCPNEVTGVRDCLADGSGWGECRCPCRSNLDCADDEYCDLTSAKCKPCIPQCGGLECDPDPFCGQSCGLCATDSLCKEGQCILAGFSAQVGRLFWHYPTDPFLAPNVEIRALDNTSGAELGINAFSDPNAWVAFEELPDGPVGFKAVGVPGEFVDTYQYDFASDAIGERLWIVNEAFYVNDPLTAEATHSAGKAMILGSLTWLNAEGGDEGVGCATIEMSPNVGDVRYFNDVSHALPIDVLDHTNSLVPYFMITNAEPGLVTVRAIMASAEVGSTQVMCFADSVCIADIFLDGASNPTPEWCEW